jgi:glyoxylase-like metal-dependent hydrolase (beta-lactamase superfamily II)
MSKRRSIMPAKIKLCRYFELYKVGENAYAAIKTDPLCMGNAGFIDLGGLVVVFDTFLCVDAARELRNMALEITDTNNMVVVNSHEHLDHYMGNCVFPRDTVIITSEEAYPRIMEAEESLEFGEKVYGDEIRGLEEKLKTAADEEEILDIENTLIILRNLCRSDIEVIPPNMVLSGSMTIHGSNGSLMLRDMGKAHSGGDIMGVLEKNRTVFTGDLLFVGEHPFLGKGNPGNLKKILEGLLKSDMEYFIPGHGPVSGRDKVSEEIEYIDSLMSLVREHIDEPNVIKVRDLPEKFHNYEGHCFKGNVDFLVRYLKSE